MKFVASKSVLGSNVLAAAVGPLRLVRRARLLGPLQEPSETHSEPRMWLRWLAASALAAITLTFAYQAEASVVYTPVNVVIANSTYGLDLDNDGVVDFTITESNTMRKTCSQLGQQFSYFGNLDVQTSIKGSGVESSARVRRQYAEALVVGSPISQGPFSALATVERVESEARHSVHGGFTCNVTNHGTGAWLGVTGRYLGLTFHINGQPHYGWAQLNVTQCRNYGCLSATLRGYAYETIAGKSIAAGQTADV